MMRLIDADAFINYIKETSEKLEFDKFHVDSAFTAKIILDGVIADLDGTSRDGFKNAPTIETELKWIPVTKALPWNETDVLVTVCDDSGDTPWEYTSVGWRTPDGKYWVVDHEICYGVIAWMPLPKPYKEVLANQGKRIK